jgi:hypothetical protein
MGKRERAVMVYVAMFILSPLLILLILNLEWVSTMMAWMLPASTKSTEEQGKEREQIDKEHEK